MYAGNDNSRIIFQTALSSLLLGNTHVLFHYLLYLKTDNTLGREFWHILKTQVEITFLLPQVPSQSYGSVC